jgi:hypothetical protein
MRTRLRLLVAALAASLLLALSAGTATAARSFSLSGGGQAILAISRVTFEANNGVQVANNVTLHGSLNSSIAKTPEALAGVITSVLFAARETCVTSEGIGCVAAPLAGTLHVRLISFTGTLPRIREIRLRIVGFAFLATVLETPQCLYRGNVEGLLILAREEVGGQVFESIRADSSVQSGIERILREELFRRCPTAGGFTTVMRLSRAITVRLV